MRRYQWAVGAGVLASCALFVAVANLPAQTSRPTTGATSQPATTRAEGEEGFEVRVSAEVRRRFGITTSTVVRRPLIETFAVPARLGLDPRSTARVSTLAEGRVVEVKIQPGDRVKRGDVLATLDSPEAGSAQSAYLEKRAIADSTKTALDSLKQIWDRARTIDAARGSESTTSLRREADFILATARAKSADAQAMSAMNRLHLLGMDDTAIANLERSSRPEPRQPLLSPIDGQIVQCDLVPGQHLTPDEDKLLVIADLSRLWVIADIPAGRINQISIGGDATIKAAGQTVSGKIAMILPTIDSATQAAQVRVDIENAPAALRPGTFATALFPQSAHSLTEPVLSIPLAAVQTLEGRSLVFVPTPDEPDTYVVRQVVVGPAVGDWVAVIRGLKEGESVASGSTFILKAEMGKGSAAD